MTKKDYDATKLLVEIAERALEANLDDYYDKRGREVFTAIEHMKPKLKRFEKKYAAYNLT